nr:cyclic nucleotide-binding domain-containing protein [Ardenticatenales bacterium]
MTTPTTKLSLALTEHNRDRSMLAHTTQLTNLLEQSELFRTLGSAERAFLADRLYRRIFKRGEVLITQAVSADKIFLIASGLVSILREDVSGVPTEAAQLGKGAIVGEMSMLTNSPPSATVVAMMDTEVWILSHDDFEQLLSQSIPLALSVNRALSAKLAATTQRLVPQRTAQLTAFFGDRREASTHRLSLELAASLARHTRERVLLVDCFPHERSPLRDEQAWGESVEELLHDPTRFAKHTAPPNHRRAHNGARLIRY